MNEKKINNKNLNKNLMEKITSLCKRRGFIFQGSESYGGLTGTYDWGHLGLCLKNNIKKIWWKKFVDFREDMYGLDSSILLRPEVWQMSGHLDNFIDPLVECKKCKTGFRSDLLANTERCPECNSELDCIRQFNLMFKTQTGSVDSSAVVVYLRPETAQGIFINFKNIVDAFHPKLPFGIGQIGKAFRNEIQPKDFLFREREFEQMEIEYFVTENDWEKYFEYWKDEMLEWMELIGLDMTKIHQLEVPPKDRAHYSKRTVDFEFEYPFGQKELFGLAYRGNFDLKNHSAFYIDEEKNEKIIPHVIEPTFGVDRAILALLLSVYQEDEKDGEARVFLKFKPSIAPIICAVFPLLKNKPELIKRARDVYADLKSKFGRIIWDDNGNIGKRYRRQDEIGTPFCITIDFDSLKDNTITIRDRDSAYQERIKITNIENYLKEKISE